MAREFAKDFYRSKEWQTVRTTVIANAFGICQRCKKKPGKIVHHIIHLTPYNIGNKDIALGLGNLKLVCKECHEAEHNHLLATTRDDVMFDKDGQLIQRQ